MNKFVLDYVNKISEYCKSFKEPIVIYDFDILKNTVNKLLDIIKKHENVALFYAVKANSNRKILKFLSGYVEGVDVASKEEASKCSDYFDNKKISVNGTEFDHGDISDFLDLGYTVDINSIDQLEKGKFNKNFGIRVAFIDDNSERISRFGINIFDEYSFNVLRLYKEKIVRFHLHYESKNLSFLISFEKILRKICQEDIFCNLCEINIGGGFKEIIEEGKLDYFIGHICKIRDNFGLNKVKIIIEPGYSIVSNCGFLCTKVVSCNFENGIQNIIVNTSAFRNCLWYRPIPINLYLDSNNKVKTNIYGNTCYELDIFCKEELLNMPKENEVILFYPVGAYSSSNHTNLHSKKYPTEHFIGEHK